MEFITERKKFIQTLKTFPRRFWLLNMMQMVERLAYWVVLLQLPVYIAQKDAPGGLMWGMDTKGIIYFWWALVQNMTAFFAGAYADRFGFKKTLLISFFIVAVSYLLQGSNRDFYPFLAATLLLGFGSGIFKSTLLGGVADSLNKKNSSVGWGIYVMLVNLAVFFAPPLSIMLKDISWTAVFIGSTFVISLNLIVILFFKERKHINGNYHRHQNIVLKNVLRTIIKPGILRFLLLMSGFTIVYMQFYVTLPNFILDWVDSSLLASIAPDFMLRSTPAGSQIAYEWFYNINTGLIILGVVFMTWLFSGRNKYITLASGILASSAGFLLCGFTNIGIFTALGFVIYTLGEMAANPKFNEIMGLSAPENNKGLYMGLLNISWAIGLAGGGISGGYLYKNFGEKAGLALCWLKENNYPTENITLNNAFESLYNLTGMTAVEAQNMLWHEYMPFLFWLPFIFMGIVSAAGIFLIRKKDM